VVDLENPDDANARNNALPKFLLARDEMTDNVVESIQNNL